MSSLMQSEALTSPNIVATQLTKNKAIIQQIITHLQQCPPGFVFTIARGSSDHAAYFAKYLFAKQTGLLCASLPPSINSIYHSKLNVRNALAIGISQSGASPDICSSLQAAKQGGATTIAIVNHTNSPLADIADFVLPLHAGEENAVAATKTYIASLTALIQLVAEFSQDKILLKALHELPSSLEKATHCDWSSTTQILAKAINLIVIARGMGYPIAAEAALKFKETANMHAEAFSAAEFQHGPMALVQPEFPLLFFPQYDATLPSTLALCQKMTQLGAQTLLATPNDLAIEVNMAQHSLPLPNSLHPICDPLMTIQAFYPMMAALAQQRGYDPDQPNNLRKVTETH